jgi:hypothetical protein
MTIYDNDRTCGSSVCSEGDDTSQSFGREQECGGGLHKDTATLECSPGRD